MNDSSKDFFKETMDRYVEQLDRDHDRLRSELMASLPDSPDELLPVKARLNEQLFGGRANFARRFLRVAAMLAIVTTTLGVLVWMQSESARAGVVFADVLRQIREAVTIRYKSTMQLGNSAPKTSEVFFKEPGLERINMPNGKWQISDYSKGSFFYVDSHGKYTLTTENKEGTQDISELQRLKNLPKEAGALISKEELDGQPVSVFDVSGNDDLITAWVDSHSGLLLKLQVVSQAKGNRDVQDDSKAVLTLSDFVWNKPLDDSLFRLETPVGYEQYHIKIINTSRPAEEEDLVEALQILTDLSEGEFPDSIYNKDLKPLLKKLRPPAASVPDKGSQGQLKTGRIEHVRTGVAPLDVRLMCNLNKRMQISRGVDFINQLITSEIPWRYIGKGVRRGERKPVFEYRPERSSRTSRIILGDLSVKTHLLKPRQDEPEQPKVSDPDFAWPKSK